ncbi:MAG: succinate--CoA ligase subunit alpha [Promethearchaeota archaeon]
MYIGKESKVIVQGITGSQGKFHTKLMLEYGTNIVAGVTPSKGGQKVHGIPVFNTVFEAVEEKEADTSIILVPAKFSYKAVKESLDAGIKMTCIITENIPVFDIVRLVEEANKKGLHLCGPNCPGMMIPDKIKLGIMPSNLCHFGNTAVISKSGTLSYEITKTLDNAGIGVSAFIGIGGDPVRGISMMEAVEYYCNEDPNTESIVLIGEIGGDEEEQTAKFINSSNVEKRFVAFIAGKNAPKGKRMGHAGAIISGNTGTAQGKITALKNAGVFIADTPWDIPTLLKRK